MYLITVVESWEELKRVVAKRGFVIISYANVESGPGPNDFTNFIETPEREVVGHWDGAVGYGIVADNPTEYAHWINAPDTER